MSGEPPSAGTAEVEPQGGATVTHTSVEGRDSVGDHCSVPCSDPCSDSDPQEGRVPCDPPGAAAGNAGQDPPTSRTAQSDCSSENCAPTPSCRICFQGAEQGQLLNPCRCDGSVRHTHQQCLLKWISERGSWTCELCCYRFRVIAIKMKKPWQWQAITITLVEKVQIIAVFLGSLFLVSSVTWLLWSAFSPTAMWQRRDVLFQICYGMYGFMDLVCIGLIVHEGAAVNKVFKRWRAVNLYWDVQNYDKAADVEEGSGGAGPSVGRSLWLPLTGLQPGSVLHPTQLGSRPASRCGRGLLCFCPGLTSSRGSSADADSGEVVIRVTSV
ncbi:E3 ubiquitin-protein ligase MARCH11 [Scleropages formosus]|uniref:RING-type E3 ubiquitin transferase n=1 Tax=Scleropages formosus TaxID=113540 RepID=A0A8C9REX5_SCLFO|nr:E3 ubiquitin-protein ligase MARCH11 [Scleropages formosus]